MRPEQETQEVMSVRLNITPTVSTLFLVPTQLMFANSVVMLLMWLGSKMMEKFMLKDLI